MQGRRKGRRSTLGMGSDLNKTRSRLDHGTDLVQDDFTKFCLFVISILFNEVVLLLVSPRIPASRPETRYTALMLCNMFVD